MNAPTPTILVLRRRATGKRVRPGDVIETHSGQRYTFQGTTAEAGVILAAPYGAFPKRPRRVRSFPGLELVSLELPRTSEPVRRGKCCACGGEWTELEPAEISICPECHSTNVVELA